MFALQASRRTFQNVLRTKVKGFYLSSIYNGRGASNIPVYMKECRYISTSSTDPEEKTDVSSESFIESMGKQSQEKLLYLGGSQKRFIIRTMFGLGAFNAFYWSAQIANNYAFKDVVVKGVALAGDPFWAFIGTAATCFICFFTREYAHSAVYQGYETLDGERLGFQFHNVLGSPGRKVEVERHTVRPVSPTQLATFVKEIAAANESMLADEIADDINGRSMKSTDINNEPSRQTAKGKITSFFVGSGSTIPLRIDGLKNNILIDKQGTYFHNYRLVELMTVLPNASSKVNRIPWQKEVYGNQRAKQSQGSPLKNRK
jgi:hypothetical protein